jgi:hypothetical protein
VTCLAIRVSFPLHFIGLIIGHRVVPPKVSFGCEKPLGAGRLPNGFVLAFVGVAVLIGTWRSLTGPLNGQR